LPRAAAAAFEPGLSPEELGKRIEVETLEAEQGDPDGRYQERPPIAAYEPRPIAALDEEAAGLGSGEGDRAVIPWPLRGS